MIAFAWALLLAQGCGSAVPVPTLAEYRLSAFNAQAALGEINAYRRGHGLISG